MIDTTDLNVHQLKERLVAAFEHDGAPTLQIAVESFGYKNGLPLDADIVMDVRFLPNPHWDESCGRSRGTTRACATSCSSVRSRRKFLDRFEEMLAASCRRTSPRVGAT